MSEAALVIASVLERRERLVITLVPTLAGVAYFAFGAIAYGVRCAIRGSARNFRSEARRGSPLVGYQLRYFFFWVTNPLWRLIRASRVRPNTLTWLAGLLGVGSALAVATGRFVLGGWLFLFSGILDVMDGRLARLLGQDSAVGAATDAILDRYTDALLLGGLAVYYRHDVAILAALAALVGTMMVSYVRAKAEAMGVAMQSGLMQRTERILVLGATVTLAPIVDVLILPPSSHPPYWLAVGGVVFLAVSTNLTALGRFRALRTALRVRERNHMIFFARRRPGPHDFKRAASRSGDGTARPV